MHVRVPRDCGIIPVPFKLAQISRGGRFAFPTRGGNRQCSRRSGMNNCASRTATAGCRMADLICRGKGGGSRRHSRTTITHALLLLLIVCATLTISHCCYVFPKGIPHSRRITNLFIFHSHRRRCRRRCR